MIEGAYPKIIFSTVDEMAKDISEQTNQYIVKQLVSLDIDPDVLTKQTMEIQRLHDELDKYRWIPVTERLPEEKTNPVTRDFYEYPVTYVIDDVKDVRYRKYGQGHWWNGAGICDEYVVAWMPLPDPY